MRLVLLSVLACIACEVPPDAKPPEAPAAPIAVERPATPAEAGPAKQADGVRLTVNETYGLDPVIVSKVYSQARESLGHCHQPGGGTVHVSIERKGTSLHMHIEPGATLDPTAHRCVLEALSTVELHDTAANAGGPAVPPSGFTSLITLTW